MDRLNELGRRVGFPPTTASSLCAKRISECIIRDELQLYDLIWAVRAAIWKLTPCASTRRDGAEIFHVEFWSLGNRPEPELQRVDAALSTSPDGSQHLHLKLTEEPAELPGTN